MMAVMPFVHGCEYNISNGKATPGYDEQQLFMMTNKNGKSLFQSTTVYFNKI
jgi:hypothetical protein